MDAVGFSSRLKRTHSDCPVAAAALAKSVDSRNNGGGGKRGKFVDGGRAQKSDGLRRGCADDLTPDEIGGGVEKAEKAEEQ